LANNNSTPTLAEALKIFFDSRLAEVLHTCLPGKIKEYDAKKRKATVIPLLKRKYLDGKILEFKPIDSVPVIFYGAGSALLRLPESQLKNQSCLLLFTERAIDSWLSKGEITEPGCTRKFDLSDAVAIVGLNSFNSKDKDVGGDDLTLQYNNSFVKIKKNGNIEMGINTFKKLLTEEVKNIFNNHVHNFIAAPSGTFSTSTPASVSPTLIPPPVTPGGAIALFGSAITDLDMTSIVKAE